MNRGDCKVREENVTVSLGFSLRFTTRIHFTFSSTARIGHSLRPSSSIRVLRAVSEEGGGNQKVTDDKRSGTMRFLPDKSSIISCV